MAKKGLTLDNVSNFIATSVDKPGWSLCIGAGTSTPLFPDWFTLAEKLAHQIVPDDEINIASLKDAGFSPDALIQMVKNRSSLNDREFAMRMSEVLYENFRKQIAPEDWSAVAKVLDSNHMSNFSQKYWKIFSKYRDTVFNCTTACSLAPVILKAIDSDLAPKSILSFNAEPLLLAILNSLILDTKSDVNHPVPPKIFNKVINSVSNHGRKQVPYIFCHGLLPVTETPHSFSTSIDKLVFLEEEYLQIANNSFSWQANTFLNACATQNIIFIGTSLTDPNMRRWLSWVHTNRINEMRYNGVNVSSSTQHYWIRKIPDDKTTMPWIESIVDHLGIRIIWINEWSQCALALEKLLGIAPKKDKSNKNKKTAKCPAKPHKKRVSQLSKRDNQKR